MRSFVYLSTFCCCLLFSAASAQYKPVGLWSGTLDAGSVKLRLVLHVSEEGGVLHSTMDSPDQGAKDIKMTSTSFTDDSLIVTAGPAAFRGKHTNDSTMEGVWIQGQRFPLTLHKAEFAARKRPQTPVAPFPYKSEDLVFTNRNKSVTYGGTLTSPNDTRRHPALLLVTGSGQQNRDEEIMEHKPFAVIADFLTRRGYVVLRVDDRGVGNTKGSLTNVTTADFAADASSALDYLKQRPEVDVRKLGVLGHSEGGMIAIMLAAERKDISFIVSLAGPGEANLQTMIEQNDAILEKKGMPADTRKAYLQLYKSIMMVLPENLNKDALTVAVEGLARDWRKATPADVVLQSTGISDDASQLGFATTFANSLDNAWIRYFMAYDPTPSIHQISCKVLALNGSNDIQVVSKGNLAGWQSALKASYSKAYQVKELPGLNHLFQHCTRCDVDEYGELEETISPTALAAIGIWLDKEAK